MEVHQDDDIIIMKETKTHIKKKRTQRPRPSPPLALTIASTTTDGAPTTNSNINFTTILQNNNDEDVANCLILLAHGQYQPPSHTVALPPRLHDVYQCKTCNRGFTSFQALGGHRVSHKNKPPHTPSGSTKGPSKPLPCNPSGSTSTKVHECSICGSDFTSGQALGGHMRRHRSVMPTTTTTCNTTDDHELQKFKKHKTQLPLDLNLPAPIEDDHDETKFSFGSNNQIIVFSTPSLVGCYL